MNREIVIDPTTSDVGAAINAADAALGAGPGKIIVPAALEYQIATPITLSSDRVLALGAAVYTPTFDPASTQKAVIELVTGGVAGPSFVPACRVAIIGDGPGTVIREVENSQRDGTMRAWELIRCPSGGEG